MFSNSASSLAFPASSRLPPRNEVGISPQLFAEVVPELQALYGQGHLGGLSALASHCAPCPSRRLVGYLALFQQDHVGAPLGEIVGGGAARDAPADDYGVSLSGHWDYTFSLGLGVPFE